METGLVSKLNQELLKQPFSQDDEVKVLEEYKQITYFYSKVENSIAILSDFNTNKSYLYYGGIAMNLGIHHKEKKAIVNSIWVDDILKKIHPDDLSQKHRLELQYVQHLKKLPVYARYNYYMSMHIRMLDKTGEYVGIHHRIYASGYHPKNLWLALCLYNLSYANYIPDRPDGVIINSVTGEVIIPNKNVNNNILTDREKEILYLIENGKMSKEISDILSISKNTVDRHRQNILEKLHVKNSLEACRLSKMMGIL